MINKITAIIAALSLVCTAAFAETFQLGFDSTEVKTAGDSISVSYMQNTPVCKNGRTLIETEDAKNIFGIGIVSDGDLITATYKDKTIKLSVGSNKIETQETKEIDVAPELIGGKIYIPLRAVLENLDWGVSYSAALGKVVVSNNPVIMEVAGNKIRLDEFNFYYDMQMKNIEGFEMTEEQKIQIESEIRSYVMDTLKELNALYYEASNSGFETILTAGNTRQEISSYAAGFSENSGIVVLDASVGVELEKTSVANNYLQAVSMAIHVSDDEKQNLYKSEYITAKHILIPLINLETGEALNEKELSDAKKLAQDIAKKIKNGEDFDKLMNEYSKDTGLENNPNGYTFTKGEMVPEFEEAAFALGEGSISDIIETTYGLHIIKRLPLEALSTQLSTALQSRIVGEKISEYVDNIILKSNIKIYGD